MAAKGHIDQMAAMGHIVQLLVVLCLTHHVTCACEDIDTTACQLMAQKDQGLCENIGLAETACRRFCGFCPLVCYHCDTSVRNTSDCVNMKVCRTGERCLLARMQSYVDGHVEFKMNCATVDQCDASGLLGLMGRRAGGATRDLSMECCTRDLCNKPAEGHLTATAVAMSTTVSHATATTTAKLTTVGLATATTTAKSTTVGHRTATTAAMSTTTRLTTPAQTHGPTTAVPNATCVRDIELVVADDRQTTVQTQHIKEFLKQIVSSLDISPLTNQVGLALISDDTQGANHLDSSKAQLLLDIDALRFEHNGPEIDIDDFVSFLGRKHDVVGGRPSVDNVVVLVLDNTTRASDLDNDDLAKLARLTHDVIVVKVGGSPSGSGISTTPIFEKLATDLDHVLSVPDYQSLPTINPQLLALLCA